MVDSIPRPPSEVPIAAIPYVVRPSLQNGATVGLQAAGVGLLVSTVQNALDTHSRGAAGVFTRTGGTVGFFGESVSMAEEELGLWSVWKA